jgi:hypothetical protein
MPEVKWNDNTQALTTIVVAIIFSMFGGAWLPFVGWVLCFVLGFVYCEEKVGTWVEGLVYAFGVLILYFFKGDEGVMITIVVWVVAFGSAIANWGKVFAAISK